VVAARAFLDVNLLDWKPALVVTAIAACLLTALLAAVNRRSLGSPWTLIGIWFVAAAYVYGGTAEADQLLDHSAPQVFHAAIVGEHLTSGKHPSWELKLGPWGPTPEGFGVPVFYRR